MESATWKVKIGLAQMLKGGAIMDVISAEQAKIAQAACFSFSLRCSPLLPIVWQSMTSTLFP